MTTADGSMPRKWTVFDHRLNNIGSIQHLSRRFQKKAMLFASISAVATLALASTSEAADPPATTSTPPPNGGSAAEPMALGEVVVTAQKRSQNLKDIPISISALGSADIARKQIADYDDITRSVPGVSFGSGGGEGLSNIEMRGVSSTSGSATVGIYLDDVSMTVSNLFDGATQPKLFDIDRIEVLRGPQGTLYGASSMGGTIRFVTKEPSLTAFSADAVSDASYTEHGGPNYGVKFDGNLPIVQDVLALRASVGYVHDSGYIDHYSSTGAGKNKGTNDESAITSNIALRYAPTDNFNLKLNLFFQDDKTGDTSVFYPSIGLWQQNKEVREPGHDTVILPSVTITDKLGFADLTLVTGYFSRRFDRTSDGTYYNSTAFAQFFLDPIYPNYKSVNDSLIGTLPSPVVSHSNYGQFSQEIRLSSPRSGVGGLPLKWVVGVYFADQHVINSNYQTIPGINNVFQQIYGIPMEQSLVETTYGAPGLVLFPNDNNGSFYFDIDQKEIAAFGQIDYDILPTLHATVGLRYEEASYDYKYSSIGFYTYGTTTPYRNLSHYSSPTPKFGLSYDIDANSNVYASAAEGYRLGGASQPIPFGPTSVCAADFAAIGVTSRPENYASDSLWSYEFGSKNRLFDNRLSVDGSVYYIGWKQIQQQIALPTCGFVFTSNIGNAESYGSELEVKFKATSHLTIGATGSIDRAVITSSNNPQTAAVGEHVLNTPGWTATVSANYSWPVTDQISGFIDGDYDWTGDSYGSYTVSNSNYHNPAYGVLNISLGMQEARWQIMLYGKNIGNDRTVIQHPEIYTVTEGYTVRPLTVGLSARRKF